MKHRFDIDDAAQARPMAESRLSLRAIMIMTIMPPELRERMRAP